MTECGRGELAVSATEEGKVTGVHPDVMGHLKEVMAECEE